MKIEELYLKNFRNVEEATYRFPGMFTVVIGMNGSGKSTLLHALKVVMGGYFAEVPDVRRLKISKDQIRVTNKQNEGFLEHLPVILKTTGKFKDDEKIIWEQGFKAKKNRSYTSIDNSQDLKNIGYAKYLMLTEQGKVNLELPLLAYFGTKRVFGPSKTSKTHRLGRRIFKEGYHEWYDLRASVFNYRNWLATYEPLMKDGKEYPESKGIFFDTILTACPYVEDVEFYNGELWLRTKMDDNISDRLPLSLKSDGIITFVEMVAELAFRCIVLNGNLRENAIKETRGVVLIDELDLHLHPKWQRHVVFDLKKAFPNLQFIVTTHSPIIVQSLEKEELINLDSEEVDGLEDAPFKYSLEEVIDSEMGVEQKKRSVKFLEMQEAAAEYFKLIKDNSDKTKVAQAKKKLDQFRILFNRDPAYVAFLESELPKE